MVQEQSYDFVLLETNQNFSMLIEKETGMTTFSTFSEKYNFLCLFDFLGVKRNFLFTTPKHNVALDSYWWYLPKDIT